MNRNIGPAALAIGCVGVAALAFSAAPSSRGVMLASAAAAPGSGACARLKDLKLANVRITAADAVAADQTFAFPPSAFNAMGGPNASVTKTAFCRVAAVIDTEIEFELWLPQDWNGRFLGVGNGGMTGAINFPSMRDGLARGFATASTDTGHKTPASFTGMFDTAWVAGHPQRVVDFGHRGHHRMAEVSKQIVAAYYGQPAKYNYYSGCSSGGWQGFTEAQKYPADYDGIVAGAPAFNFIKLQTRSYWLSQLSAGDPAGDLGPALNKLVISSALQRCDGEDGVKDGVMDPSRCDFDPAQLQCAAGHSDNCLTSAQVARVRRIYGPARTKAGMSIYPGSAYGAPAPLDVSNPLGSKRPMIAEVLAGTDLEGVMTPQAFDADRDTPRIESRIGGDLSSYDPNLKAFSARGGKIVMYHGWADPLLSPYNSIAYVQSVDARLGKSPRERFLRLFMVPGMGHCGGGPGTDSFDGLAAVQAWVEHGQAPQSLMASHMTKGVADRTRPLCPIPQVAAYKGTGSTDDAANFVCRKG